ncbi:MAG: hypothetical protein JKY56_13430 [Kofleriaceae bacterium]|nr:hypothetical protein [Kofleriaceae bacterium]
MPDPTSDLHPFRNGDSGTEAKRLHLLQNRRDDWATMPHGIRQVYVARVARIFACSSLAFGGLLVLAAIKYAGFADAVSELVPGATPAPLPTLLLATWIVAGFALLMGRSLAEFRFGLAMSKAVLPTQELYGDVDRLQHESPDNVARSMARRLEAVSRLSPVLAFACIIPATVLSLHSLATVQVAPVNALEANLISQSTLLIAIAGLGLGLAFLMAIRPSTSVRTLSGVAALFSCISFASLGQSTTTLLLCSLTLIAWIAARSVRKHLRENAKIEQEGTPLPAVFSFKRAYANLRSTLHNIAGKCKSFVTTRALPFKVFAALALFTGIAGASYLTFSEQDIAPLTIADASPGQTTGPRYAQGNLDSLSPKTNTAAQLDSSATRASSRDGMSVNFVFADMGQVNATALLEGAKLPTGWEAHVTISLESSDHPLFLDGLPGTVPRHLSSTSPSVSFSYTNCTGAAMPLSLTATPYLRPEGGATSATVNYTAQLSLVSCN